jgi:hypothetical protein
LPILRIALISPRLAAQRTRKKRVLDQENDKAVRAA